MSIIDFKEIAKANGADGRQDEFELFARDFFELLKFKIDEGPDRGADGGRDLIIIEKRSGLIDDTEIRWLVSCKHYAHSGKSVGENDEVNVSDRLTKLKCNGFLGFYSTLPSSGLTNTLNSFKDKYEISIFDHKKIERTLLDELGGVKLIQRYFPESYQKEQKSIKPSIIYSKYYPLKCECCGKDLIKKGVADSYQGNVVMAVDGNLGEVTKYKQVYCVCKGECDRNMIQSKFEDHTLTKWEDISDLVIPFEFAKWNMAIMNNLRSGSVTFTDDAYEQLKYIILAIAQVVMRQPTNEEVKRSKSLIELPDGI